MHALKNQPVSWWGDRAAGNGRFLHTSLGDGTSAPGLQNAGHLERAVMEKEKRCSPDFPSNLWRADWPPPASKNTWDWSCVIRKKQSCVPEKKSFCSRVDTHTTACMMNDQLLPHLRNAWFSTPFIYRPHFSMKWASKWHQFHKIK